MTDLFNMGGPLFMGILTLIAFLMLVWSFLKAMQVIGKSRDSGILRHQLSYIKAAGILGLVIGILGQLIGLYQAFATIEQLGSVSPGILAGGLKVSSITTLYGLIIFIVAYVIWMVLDNQLNQA
ncbi:MAG: MotA/TolQ/ExbB proton channel family protein [Candidatus Cyclobacteriaceae bacterium M3_2C_046]